MVQVFQGPGFSGSGFKVRVQGPGPGFKNNHNKNYRLRKLKFFLFNKRKIDVKPTVHQNSVVPKALLGKL